MLDQELLKKIKRLNIKSSHLSNEIFAGEYKSSFRGQGIEFEEFREYSPGDDIRMIDWNVTARSQKPFLKVFREERQMSIVIMVDMSASGNFGSQNKEGKKQLKQETYYQIAGILAHAAQKNNDKVGLLLFTDQVECFLPPKASRAQVYHILKELLSFTGSSKKTSLKHALKQSLKHIKRRSICFLISDFQDQGFKKELGVFSRKHQVTCVRVFDQMEAELAPLGYVFLDDLETEQSYLSQLDSRSLTQEYKTFMHRFFEENDRLVQSSGADLLVLNHNSDYVESFLKYFHQKEKRH